MGLDALPRRMTESPAMRTRAELAAAALTSARDQLVNNVRAISIGEALQAAGGYRSILGILKHAASWSHVYRSYAFDAEPPVKPDPDGYYPVPMPGRTDPMEA